MAAATLGEALDSGDGSARCLSRYQRAWRTVIGSEIRTGTLFRSFASQLSDAQIDEAFHLVAGEPLARLIRDYASFNWHKQIIVALWRSSAMRGFLWQALMRRGGRMIGALRPSTPKSPVFECPEEGAVTD
ncbi:MAG: hypothetical protein M5R38_17440 [Candidatus Methylomirabilis sp.]|nr:hypothetical protein [Candidatus Methylomirabilis sp.]